MLLLFPAGAAADTASFVPSADSYVYKSTQSTNYGAATSVRSDGNPVTRGLMRFTVSGIPAGATVSAARLNAKVIDASANGPAAYEVTSLWTETGVTWKNQPARTTGFVLDDIGNAAVGSTASWNVAGLFASGNPNKTINLQLAQPGSDELHVASREHAAEPDPTLTIAYTAPPPADTTPPETTIVSGPPPNTTATGATFEFSADEPATFDCSLDGGAFTSCSSPMTLAGLAQGTHTFRVRARDQAGNVDQTPAVYSWTVEAVPPPPDTTPPETTIDSGPPGSTTQTSAAFTFSGNEASTFECALDAGAFASCTSPKAYSGLSVGAHTFEVRATDASGNTDPTPASRGWMIEPMLAPETTISGVRDADSESRLIAGTWYVQDEEGDGEATLVDFTVEPGASAQCQLDTAMYVDCSEPTWSTSAAAGPHTIRVQGVSGDVVDPSAAEVSIDVLSPGEPFPDPSVQCNDGQDNDGDGKIDYPADTGCSSAADSSESPDPVPPGADPVVAIAGDIAGGDAGTRDTATADVLAAVNPDRVLTMGDNAYVDGTLAQFQTEYDPTWGRFKARTYPSPGNHEYHTPNAQGYRDYFGYSSSQPLYYSFDLGNWHLIALDTEISTSASSAQGQWLAQDLSSVPASKCVLAYWHKPRYTSGSVHGPSSSATPLQQQVYDAGGDIVANGHNHQYERFALQDNASHAVATGVRNFVVGTGGAAQYTFGTPQPNSELRATNQWGVLKLTLHPNSYDWEFKAVPGSTLNDSGSTACHNP